MATPRRLETVGLAAIVLTIAFGGHLHEPAVADEDKSASKKPIVLKVGPNELKLAPPPWTSLTRRSDGDEQLRAWWIGTWGECKVRVEIRSFPRKEYRLDDPEDVADFAIYSLRDTERGGSPKFALQTRDLVEGKYGVLALGSICAGILPHAGDPKGEVLLLGGILKQHGYNVGVYAQPALPKKDRESVLAYFRQGVTAEAKLLNPKWTDEEAKARWEKDVLSKKTRKKLKPFVRTKHYIIFTNSGAGKLFAKKMESCYKYIQKVYPFPEVKGRRLMPVFLFRLPGEYYTFCYNVAGWDMEAASSTKGHAGRDYYATYYASPNDPVHIHEATHQVFMNRLFLGGGGSWFQEGVAEYICTKPGERKAYAKPAARRDKFTPFSEFVSTPSLISSGWQEANAAYLQAASIIEFLRDSKWRPKQFQTFIHRMGLAPDNNAEAIEKIVRDVYGTDLDGLQAEWQKYWKRR